MNENEIMEITPIEEEIEVVEETSNGNGIGLGILIGAGLVAGAILAATKGRKVIGKLKNRSKKNKNGDDVIDADYEEVVSEMDSE